MHDGGVGLLCHGWLPEGYKRHFLCGEFEYVLVFIYIYISPLFLGEQLCFRIRGYTPNAKEILWNHPKPLVSHSIRAIVNPWSLYGDRAISSVQFLAISFEMVQVYFLNTCNNKELEDLMFSTQLEQSSTKTVSMTFLAATSKHDQVRKKQGGWRVCLQVLKAKRRK